jgi:integrase
MARGSTFKRCPCGSVKDPETGKRVTCPVDHEAVTGACACGIVMKRGRRLTCQKSHGSWWWRAEGVRDPATGKRRQPAQGGYATQAAAEDALAVHLAGRVRGDWADDQGKTLGQWLDEWLAAGRWAVLTRATYEGHVRTVWKPRLGSIRLGALRRFHVEDVLRDVADREDGTERQPRTLRSYHATLRAALASALNRGLVKQNAAGGSMDAIPKSGRPELRMWQPSELRRFLGSVDDDPLRALWHVAAFTGLRRAELCGLRWIDVDTADRHPGITVRQTVPALAGRHRCSLCGGSHTGAFIKASPKSDAGARWVPLVAEAVDALKVHRVRQEAEQALWGEAYSPHGLVFAREDGTPLSPSAVTQRFARLVAAVRDPGDPEWRLPVVRPHDMRHGAASMMIAAGVPMETVSLILGHSTTAVTRQIYTHVLRGPAAAALEAAAAMVRGEPGAQSVHTPRASSEVGEVIEPRKPRSGASSGSPSEEAQEGRYCITNSVK